MERYRSLASRHLTDVRTGTAAPDTIWLECRTSTSDIRIGLAARTVTDVPARTVDAHEDARAARLLRLSLADGRTVTVDKTVALHTSHDPAIKDPAHAALDRVGRAPDFATLLDSHRTAWQQLWRNAELDVPNSAGPVLRLHLFHLLQTLSPHTAELDVGVPARGLHGEAYRGHVFWDELFVLPYLNLHFPEVSRALLALPPPPPRRRPAGPRATPGTRARCTRGRAAATAGRRPSDCTSTRARGAGCPTTRGSSATSARPIAYNVWQYCQATGDTEFLHTTGAEMLCRSPASGPASRRTTRPLGRYRIRGVMGPDEYHDAYPGAERPGLDDNAYTNVIAAWVLRRALDVLDDLPELPRRELLRDARPRPRPNSSAGRRSPASCTCRSTPG